MTKAEIGFETFPCGPCATDADRALRSLEGVVEVLFDSSVRRASVLFDPGRVNITHILTTLKPFVTKPRVISVATPLKGEIGGENRNL